MDLGWQAVKPKKPCRESPDLKNFQQNQSPKNTELCEKCRSIFANKPRIRHWEYDDPQNFTNPHHQFLSHVKTAAEKGCPICKNLWREFKHKTIDHDPMNITSIMYMVEEDEFLFRRLIFAYGSIPSERSQNSVTYAISRIPDENDSDDDAGMILQH